MEPASPANKYHYDPKLGKWAHDLRSGQTKSETVICKHALRKRQASGFEFDRQRPVFNFIADFMCRPFLLIIEIDGLTHQDPKVMQKDEWRTK